MAQFDQIKRKLETDQYYICDLLDQRQKKSTRMIQTKAHKAIDSKQPKMGQKKHGM